jgi:hypothetical protein
MTLGDFNGDGKLDLAVASGLTQILFGNGNGTFRPAVDYGTEQSNPNSLAAGDFTGQGRLDLVVAVAGASSISEMVQSMLAPSAADVTFPLQVLKTSSAAQKVTLTNVGRQLINVKSIAITGANATDFTQTDTCGLSLAPRASCTINNTFSPRNVGPRTASITITDSAVGSPQSIALQGIGVVTGPNATLSTTSLSISCRCHFPPLPPPCGCQCSYSPITLSDFGKTDLSITGISTTSLFTERNTCDGSLKPGNACTITVGLRGHGSFTGTLNINDNAPGSPQVVNLTGSNSCRFP